MAILKQYTRTVDLTGLSGNPGDLDPLFWMAENLGGGSTTLTYQTNGGQPGFALGTNAVVWAMTAIPFAAYCDDDALLPATSLQIEWECSNSGTYSGGPFFLHYSNGLYGNDISGYLVVVSGSAISVLSRGSVNAYTTVATGTADTTNSWMRMRATLTPGSAGTKNLLIEQFVGSAWVTKVNASGLTSMMGKCGIGWRNTSSKQFLCRGPNGASGPVVTWMGPELVVVPIGQSELSGFARDNQVNNDGQILTVNRSTGAMALMTDPWEVSPAANAKWTGIIAELQAAGRNPAGSAIPKLCKMLRTSYGSVIAHSCYVRAGQSIFTMEPPASSTRYLTSSIAGAAALMTTIWAGDGQTPGQSVYFGIWHTTGDFGTDGWTGTTTKATYKAALASIVARLTALWPTSRIHQAIIGDRTWRYPTAAADNQELREAHLEVAGENDCYLWFDEAQRTGMPGSETGWPDLSPDGVHPDTASDAWVSRHMAVGMGYDPLQSSGGISLDASPGISFGGE